MLKRIVTKASLFLTVLLCFLMSFNSAATAVGVNSEALSVESISITSQHGIVQGKSVQLSAMVSPENAVLNSVEWYSSNPEVISCTESGKITGVSAGDFADITCKAKWSSASKTIRVYCVEPTGSYVKTSFVNPATLVFAQPHFGMISGFHFNIQLIFGQLIRISSQTMNYNSYSAGPTILMDAKCEIRGRYGSYAYIVFPRENGYIDGFVMYSWIKNTEFNGFLKLSSTNMDVWGNGYIDSRKVLTTNYNGDIEWTVSDPDIISFDDKTGQVIGKKPGIARITATAEGISRNCTVHSLYRWPQKDGASTSTKKCDWETQTNRNTSLYAATGTGYSAVLDLEKGTSFTVYGESGTADGKAYGCVTGTDYWGYIPIKCISTKGTILQYLNMNWQWPVNTERNNTEANYISSPYGWRNTDPAMHKGIDITTGNKNEIEGYEVVSAFDGEVIYISTNASNSTGYCVGVRSEETDPISGKNFVAFYMHLDKKPSFVRGELVSKGERLGFVGNTGNSGGYHLHFEANNQNASIGNDARNYYANLINPIFFYLDPTYKCSTGSISDKEDNIIYRINSESDAVSKYNGVYWYGDDREENEP